MAEPAIDSDTAFDLLANVHRRRLLLALQDHPPTDDEPPTVDDRFDDCPDRIRIAMHHRHLPKLDEYDVINWDPATGRVRRGPSFDEIRAILERLDRR